MSSITPAKSLHKGVYSSPRYKLEDFGEVEKPAAEALGDIATGKNRISSLSKVLRQRLATVGGDDRSRVDFGVFTAMLEEGLSPQDALATFIASKRGEDARERKNDFDDYLQRTITKAVSQVKSKKAEDKVWEEIGEENEDTDDPGFFEAINGASEPNDWRTDFKSKNQLARGTPRYVVSRLVPENALTMITAPSYHGKSWIALHLGRAISTGKAVWGFDGPERPVPFRYHVPEMNESMVRQRMEMLHIADSEMFLVRAMESGAVWGLDDERMLASSLGAVVCLDTTGYFNDADDTSNYQQAVKFGKLVFNLLTSGGAVAVIGLYHPPKYSSKETTMTLENMLLGSAGYGGILRSCLGVRSMNKDLNDENLWLYVQGIKNPRLKPFQLGGIPLTLKSEPGESPYLNELLAEKSHQTREYREKKLAVIAGIKSGKSVRSIADDLHVSHNTIKKIREEMDEE